PIKLDKVQREKRGFGTAGTPGGARHNYSCVRPSGCRQGMVVCLHVNRNNTI
ncbi:hypothetical protein J6590_039142, partial [Homalodisca vitripennis]